MHNYKKDCADIFPGIEIWTEWIYYVMGRRYHEWYWNLRRF